MITPTMLKILEHVAHYKFLTPTQMVTLGIRSNTKKINDYILRLKKIDASLIAHDEVGLGEHFGRIERTHYLTKKGYDFLKDIGYREESILFPKSKKSFKKLRVNQDYFHRKSTISIQIAFDLFAQEHGLEVKQYLRYIDKVGNNRTDRNLRALSRLELTNGLFFIPDSLVLISQQKKDWLFAIEVCNGDNTQRILDQMKNHTEALHLGAMSKKFDVPVGNRVLAIFELESTMKLVMKRIRKASNYHKNYEKFSENHFLFATIDGVQKDLNSGWITLLGEVKKLFEL